MPAAQVKAFWDSTGQEWQSGALVGKLAGLFFGSGTQHGGQETTAFAWFTQLVHHGMVSSPFSNCGSILDLLCFHLTSAPDVI